MARIDVTFKILKHFPNRSRRREKLRKKIVCPLAFAGRERIIQMWFEVVHFVSLVLLCFWRIIMAAVEKVKNKKLSPSQKKLIAILREHAQTKTVDEIAPLYAAAMGKESAEPSSVTTAISMTRAVFKANGKKFPEELEPVKKSGGGRASTSENLEDALNDLGFDFEELEDIKPSKVVATATATGDNESGS